MNPAHSTFSIDSGSSTGSEVPLFDRRLHRGYGSSRVPLNSPAGIGFTAGHHFRTAEHHLGIAARPVVNDNVPQQGTWHVDAKGNWVQANKPSTSGKLDNLTPGSAGFKWNKATRKAFPKEWRAYKVERDSKKDDNSASLTLPYSNNIGPGNIVQEALTNADTIAQGHDLHYSEPGNVQEADKEAIIHFAHETIYGSNPVSQVQAAIGVVGLGVKHVAEHIYGGTLYGKGKRWLNHLVHRQMSERIGSV